MPETRATDDLFTLINSDGEVEESLRLYRQAQRERDEERRRGFERLGVSPQSRWPASAVFHQHSSIAHDTLMPLDADQAAELTRNLDYKRYPSAPRVALGLSTSELELGLEEAVVARRSVREFTSEPVSFDLLSASLRLSCGVTQPDQKPPHRASPSAGALYPIEVYVMALEVDGLERGLYHYDPLEHELEAIHRIDGPEDLWPILCHGLRGVEPAVAFLLAARLPRIQAKYMERGYRFALLECGHIAQNLLLVATAARLGSVAVGGFVDDEMNRLLRLDGEAEVGLYGVLIGHPGSKNHHQRPTDPATSAEGTPM